MRSRWAESIDTSAIVPCRALGGTWRVEERELLFSHMVAKRWLYDEVAATHDHPGAQHVIRESRERRRDDLERHRLQDPIPDIRCGYFAGPGLHAALQEPRVLQGQVKALEQKSAVIHILMKEVGDKLTNSTLRR